jgi:hypothetical protein
MKRLDIYSDTDNENSVTEKNLTIVCPIRIIEILEQGIKHHCVRNEEVQIMFCILY